ncbi:MAG TPA: DUF429 domain-containing protein [Polyangiaceae bacterium]|nr:DUF429 domain-containing protein [Polyangiaceae bacterium]
MTHPWTVVGLDPAPKKRAVACVNGETFQAVDATDLPKYVSDLLSAHERLLIAWDAPLSFDPKNGYSDRPADREMRKWVKAQRLNKTPVGSPRGRSVCCHFRAAHTGPSHVHRWVSRSA